MAKDKRVTLTIKLLPDADSDIIKWWSSLPLGSNKNTTGSRNTYAKTVLRYAIKEEDHIRELEAEKVELASQLQLEQTRVHDLQGDIDLLRRQATKAYDQQDRDIKELRTILSRLPIIAEKAVQQFVPTQSDAGRLDDIQQQLNGLMERIEEVAKTRGTAEKPTKKRTLSEEELADRDHRMQKTNW